MAESDPSPDRPTGSLHSPLAVHTHTSGCGDVPLVANATAPFLLPEWYQCHAKAMGNDEFPNRPGPERFREETVGLYEINRIRFRSPFPKHWSFSTKTTILPHPDITPVITFPSTCLTFTQLCLFEYNSNFKEISPL